MPERSAHYLKPNTWFSTNLPKPFANVNSYNTKDKMLEWIPAFTEQYYTPLCPIFSSQIESIDDIRDYEVVTLRDGLVPLLWFFKRIKNPNLIKPQLLIHKNLQRYVPRNWQKHVNFYEIASMPSCLRQKRSKLLISGILADQYSNQKQIDQNLMLIDSFLSANKITDIDVELFFPVLNDPFYLEDPSHTIIFDFTEKLLKKFSTIARSWSSKNFYKTTDFSDYYFLELDNSLLFQDSSLGQSIMRKNGCSILPTSEPFSTLALSPFHQINISLNQNISTEQTLGDKLLQDFDELYSIDESPSTRNEKIFNPDLLEPKNFCFPNDFYKFIKAHYNLK